MYPFAMTFGKRLQKALDLAKLERKTLAAKLGVTPQAIGMVITGGGKTERRLSPENTRKAARLLKVDFEWLSTGEIAPSTPSPHKPETSAVLSHDAIQLAQWFDKIPDGLGKVMVRQICMQAIIEALNEPDPAQTPTLDQPVKHEKPHA